MTDILDTLKRGHDSMGCIGSQACADAIAEIKRLRAIHHAFRAVDDLDWRHLDSFIPQSGHGKFWRAVFAEVRAAISPGAKS
jgi:hypothetical protein